MANKTHKLIKVYAVCFAVVGVMVSALSSSLSASAATTVTSLDVTTGSTDGGQVATFEADLDVVFKQVSVDDRHSLALTTDGRIYAWGENASGQLGNGTYVDSSLPIAVDPTLFPVDATIAQVVAGYRHSLALTTDGQIYAWGRNASGELGIGSTVESIVPTLVDTTNLPAGVTFKQIAAGYIRSAALATDGQIYTWGSGLNNIPTPVDMTAVPSNEAIDTIVASQEHFLALTTDGHIYAWGGNIYGQLGDGTTSSRSGLVPVDVAGLPPGTTFSQVAAGRRHSMALASDGQLYAWGYNGYGQFGDGTNNDSLVPTAVDMTGLLAGKSISQITAGSDHSLVLTTEGRLYSWGGNVYGRLGDGTTSHRDLPTAVDTTNIADQTIAQIAGFSAYSLVITSEGTLYSWGENVYGQLGDGTTINSLVPIAVDLEGILTSPPRVTFGGVIASDIEIIDATSFRATVPPHDAGTVDVVITFAGQPPITMAGAYTYVAASDTTSGVSSYQTSGPEDRLADTGAPIGLFVAVSGLTALLGVGLLVIIRR